MTKSEFEQHSKLMYDAWNHQDVEAVLERYTEDVVYRDLHDPLLAGDEREAPVVAAVVGFEAGQAEFLRQPKLTVVKQRVRNVLPLGELALLIEALRAEAEYGGAKVRQLPGAVPERTALRSATPCTRDPVPAGGKRLAGNAGLRVDVEHQRSLSEIGQVHGLPRRRSQHHCGYRRVRKVVGGPVVLGDRQVLRKPVQIAGRIGHRHQSFLTRRYKSAFHAIAVRKITM